MPDRTIKKGDNYPPIEATLKYTPSGAAVATVLDLSTASSVCMIWSQGTMVQIATMAIPSPALGRVKYDLATTDTATPGTWDVEFEVNWPNGKQETVPNTGVRQILIEEDLRP